MKLYNNIIGSERGHLWYGVALIDSPITQFFYKSSKFAKWAKNLIEGAI